MRKLFFIGLCLLSFSLGAWNNEDLANDMLKQFQQMFDRMDRDFGQHIDRIRKQMERNVPSSTFQITGRSNVNYHWKEDKKTRTLVVEVEGLKNTPIDIKIKDGAITVKGTIQEKTERKGPGGNSFISSSSYSFQNGPITIPADVDHEGAKFEQKKDKVLITFPKLGKGRTPIKHGGRLKI